MVNPSVSMPDDLVIEIDDRRHSTTGRSEWIREALYARLVLEDEGDWDEVAARVREDPEIEGIRNSGGLSIKS